MTEQPLQGGRLTPGVVRIAATLRRPLQPNSRFVRRVLRHLERSGFAAVPRYLGRDPQGREVFTFIDGAVPPELDARFPDPVLSAAARLIRRFHDATAGTPLAAGAEVVCHNDLSPCNFVFRDGFPVALIDFDSAAPGARLSDLAYALFLWLNLGTDGPAPAEQGRRITVFCGAYGVATTPSIVDAIEEAVRSSVERLHRTGRSSDAEWWSAQLDWLRGSGVELRAALTPPDLSRDRPRREEAPQV